MTSALRFSGAIPANLLPFNEDLSFDEVNYRKHLSWLAAVDGVEDTDGLDVVSAPLGPRYPMGLLVVQDGVNLAPDGAEANQNFKLVSWRDVIDALDLAPAEGP